MLRVGLTGELGSGKSTVARLLAAQGAIVLSSDEMGRAMMQPGQPVFHAIVQHFGPSVLVPDGTLDRRALAVLAFDPAHPRVEELNALIHPAVLAEQERQIGAIAKADPHAVVIVESALLFTTKHVGTEEPWRERFDAIVLVTAPEEVKIQRFIERTAGGRSLTARDRSALVLDAQRRLAAQRIPLSSAAQCLLIANDGGIEAVSQKVDDLWRRLKIQESKRNLNPSKLNTRN